MTSVYNTPGLQSAVQSIISGSTGSGTDVGAIVNALVTAKVAGQNSIIGLKQASAKSQVSALGALKSALSALQDSVKSLSDGKAMAGFVAKTDGKGIAPVADKYAVSGSYSITVENIATPQSISSGAFDGKEKLGQGTLKVSMGGKEISVAINDSNNTLSGIAAAINKASGGADGVATVVNGVDGAHLVLRSSETGVNNAISVSVDLTAGAEDKGLSKLSVSSSTSTVDPNDPTKSVSPYTTVESASGWTQSVAGQDASLLIAGTRVRSSSNQVENAIAGVTLSLGQDAVGTTQTLSIQRDTDAQKNAIASFADAYNKFVTTATSLTAFDANAAAGSQGAVLLGDSMLNGIRNELARIIGKGVSFGTTMTTLASIGVSLQADGQLKVDDNALKAALSSSPDKIQALFNSKTGIAADVSNRIDAYVKKDGIIDKRLNTVLDDSKGLDDQQKRLAAYADELTNKYNAQFTALNNLMARMNSNTSYLTQLFGSGNNSGTLNAK